jgi:hypothetical protein
MVVTNKNALSAVTPVGGTRAHSWVSFFLFYFFLQKSPRRRHSSHCFSSCRGLMLTAGCVFNGGESVRDFLCLCLCSRTKWPPLSLSLSLQRSLLPSLLSPSPKLSYLKGTFPLLLRLPASLPAFLPPSVPLYLVHVVCL